METALLPDERTELVSTTRLGRGWTSKKLTISNLLFRTGCKDGCDLVYDWLPAYVLQPICRQQKGALKSIIKRPNAAFILPSFL